MYIFNQFCASQYVKVNSTELRKSFKFLVFSVKTPLLILVTSKFNTINCELKVNVYT